MRGSEIILLVVLDADALEDFGVLATAHLANDLVVVLGAEGNERRHGPLCALAYPQVRLSAS